MPKLRTVFIVAALGCYCASYGYMRGKELHAVESYRHGKGGPREDYIALKPRGSTSPMIYHIYQPLIALEEAVRRIVADPPIGPRSADSPDAQPARD